jgi:plasmid stabilization system protein ParE
MNVRCTAQAPEEVDQAGVHYELSSEKASEAFFARLEQATHRVGNSARTFPLVRGRRRGREIRSLSLDKFPYVLVYEVLTNEVVIISLWHDKSRSEDWSLRET